MKIKTERLGASGNPHVTIRCSRKVMEDSLSMLMHSQVHIHHNNPGENSAVFMFRSGAKLYYDGGSRWFLATPAAPSAREVEAALAQLRAGYYLKLAGAQLQLVDDLMRTDRQFRTRQLGMLSVYPSGEKASRS